MALIKVILHFLKKLSEQISSFENPTILIGGDWNATKNPQLDNLNYRNVNNPKNTREMGHSMPTHSLLSPAHLQF